MARRLWMRGGSGFLEYIVKSSVVHSITVTTHSGWYRPGQAVLAGAVS